MITGHEKTVSLLSKIAETDSPPHALLFTGPDGSGKKKIAIEFAKWLLHRDEDKIEVKPQSTQSKLRFNLNLSCSCQSCCQVDSRSHPDFYLLEESPIQIKQVRDLKERFSLSPFYSSKKIAIIDNAESMRSEAANAFLKMLEEPRGDTIFIVIAKSRLAVLPTISSRTFEIRFIAGGDWYKKFLSKKDDLSKIKFFEYAAISDKFLEIQKYSLSRYARSGEAGKNKEELIGFLNSWLIELRGRLLFSTGARPLGTRGLTPSNDYSLMRHILYAKQLISTTNTNPQLIMEELCVTHYL